MIGNWRAAAQLSPALADEARAADRPLSVGCRPGKSSTRAARSYRGFCALLEPSRAGLLVRAAERAPLGGDWRLT